MKISFSWIQSLIPFDQSPEALAEILTRAGLEVDSISSRGADFPNVVTARIIDAQPHPDADRLQVCQVDDGSGEPRQIVCGAKNFVVGDVVPLALPGAVLPGNFKIKVGKLRGVKSEGMLCSAKELQLAEDAAGLLILPRETQPGQPISALYPAESVLEVEITSNRADWLSHIGVAREIRAFTGASLTLPSFPDLAINEDAGAATISASEACLFYSLLRISNVSVAASPDWLQRRLEAIGLRPINQVVDITNFVLFERGQPLHAFDAVKVRGPIEVRFAVADEQFVALDGKTYVLEPTDLVIADSTGPIALAGVMGGLATGVSETTTDLLLESALFNPVTVRKTSRRLGLTSDSSYRFERGVDPLGVVPAAARAADLICQWAGGTAANASASAGNLPRFDRQIAFDPDACRQVLGLDIPNGKISDILARLGLTEVPAQPHCWQIPSYRGDLERAIDLTEEVIRVHGIEHIVGKMTVTPAASSTADLEYDFANTLRARLVGAGFYEARTSTLVSESVSAGLPAQRIRNPLGGDQAILRPTLIGSLLTSLQRNLNVGEATVRMFEVGRIFSATSDAEEASALALVMTGPIQSASWRAESLQNADLFDLKGVLELLVPGLTFKRIETPRFGLTLEIQAGDFVVGVAAQLAPAEARKLDAKGPVLVAELYLDPIRTFWAVKLSFTDIPRFPASTRDIAVVMPESLDWQSIHDTIRANQPAILESLEPFDVFVDPTGEKLPADRKSLAFSLTFRSPDGTLETRQVDDAVKEIKTRLSTSLPVEFRE